MMVPPEAVTFTVPEQEPEEFTPTEPQAMVLTTAVPKVGVPVTVAVGLEPEEATVTVSEATPGEFPR